MLQHENKNSNAISGPESTPNSSTSESFRGMLFLEYVSYFYILKLDS